MSNLNSFSIKESTFLASFAFESRLNLVEFSTFYSRDIHKNQYKLASKRKENLSKTTRNTMSWSLFPFSRIHKINEHVSEYGKVISDDACISVYTRWLSKCFVLQIFLRFFHIYIFQYFVLSSSFRRSTVININGFRFRRRKSLNRMKNIMIIILRMGFEKLSDGNLNPASFKHDDDGDWS